ncbi:hypothetical protein [Pseudofrankia asymbiotica]|uniref:Uncharacterized protein n=1 Tax=Pseudofrankia asymbiotica TaxID=1834516 RepID=A0A1V2I7E8_9ACTN|nr:hypothetical protein [Pseudofrankia asymbiotica]ONH27770.1 hypothetical protein BL253_21265 [Pseudofrankia asymbiotica]
MSSIRVGRPDVAIDASAHTPGVPQGNAKGAYEREAGHHPDGKADARRSTGIVPERHNPVLPSMPNIPPP